MRPSARLANGNRDRRAGVRHAHAALDAVGGRHRDRAHLIAADVLLHFGSELHLRAALGELVDRDLVEDLRQILGLELDVEHRPDHLHDLSDIVVSHD